MRKEVSSLLLLIAGFHLSTNTANSKKNLGTLVLTLSSLDYLQGHCIPGTVAIACSSVFFMFSHFFAFSSIAPISDWIQALSHSNSLINGSVLTVIYFVINLCVSHGLYQRWFCWENSQVQPLRNARVLTSGNAGIGSFRGWRRTVRLGSCSQSPAREFDCSRQWAWGSSP